MDPDSFDPSRPSPVCLDGTSILNDEEMNWASYVAYNRHNKLYEGAQFFRIDPTVFIISVRGGQPLHDDRHLDDMPDTNGYSHDTWNLVIEPSDAQQLLLEVADGMFEHFPLDGQQFIYMNTFNRHAVTRKSPEDFVVLVQVDGFGPDQVEEAIAALRAAVVGRTVFPDLPLAA